MRYLFIALLLVGCGPNAETRKVKDKVVSVSKVDKKSAYANCVKAKESEVDNTNEASKRYSWTPQEIKKYCKENWRAYRD